MTFEIAHILSEAAQSGVSQMHAFVFAGAPNETQSLLPLADDEHHEIPYLDYLVILPIRKCTTNKNNEFWFTFLAKYRVQLSAAPIFTDHRNSPKNQEIFDDTERIAQGKIPVKPMSGKLL